MNYYLGVIYHNIESWVNQFYFAKGNIPLFIYLILPLRSPPPYVFGLGVGQLLQHFLRTELVTVPRAVSCVQSCLLCGVSWLASSRKDSFPRHGEVWGSEAGFSASLDKSSFPAFSPTCPVTQGAALYQLRYVLLIQAELGLNDVWHPMTATTNCHTLASLKLQGQEVHRWGVSRACLPRKH